MEEIPQTGISSIIFPFSGIGLSPPVQNIRGGVIMNQKPNLWQRAVEFITGKGFYLAVLVCVMVIGLSAYFMIQSVRSNLSKTADHQASSTASITVTPAPRATATPRPTPKPTPTPAPTPQPTPEATAQPTSAYSWPVSGTVISSFSVEALSYNETMGDWRTHDGIDIASSLGTRVQATAKGVVSAVYEDDVMGVTVVVDHGNELFSVYSNLEENPPVAMGDTVASDTVVGEVGETSVAESGKQPHLHFAMYQGDAPINPEDYLGQ